MKPEHLKLLRDKRWRLNNLYFITDKQGKKVRFRMTETTATRPKSGQTPGLRSRSRGREYPVAYWGVRRYRFGLRRPHERYASFWHSGKGEDGNLSRFARHGG